MTTAVLPAAPAAPAAPAPARASRPAADGDAFEQVLRSQAEPTDAADAAAVDPADDEASDPGSDRPGDAADAVVPEPTPQAVVNVPVLPLAASLPAAVTPAVIPPTDGRQPSEESTSGTAVAAPAGGQEPATVSMPVAAPPTGGQEPTSVSAPVTPGAPVPSRVPTPAGAGDTGSAGDPVAPTPAVTVVVPSIAEGAESTVATQVVPMDDSVAPRPDAPTTPLQAVAQPATTAPAAPVAPSAPATPAAAPTPLHTQVVTAVSPLLTGPDGTHQLTVRLDPDGLGAVHVRLTVSGDEVRMHLVAADAATREALRDGLGQLRTQLEDVGLRATHLDVASDGDHRQQAGAGAEDRHRPTGAPDRPGTRHGPAPPAATQHPAPTTHRPDTRLDLRM